MKVRLDEELPLDGLLDDDVEDELVKVSEDELLLDGEEEELDVNVRLEELDDGSSLRDELDDDWIAKLDELLLLDCTAKLDDELDDDWMAALLEELLDD